MRLFYYDDVTPEDYEPPGFQECRDAPPFEFVADAECVEISGEVKTRHHSVSLKLDTAMPNVTGMNEDMDSDLKKAMKICAKSVYLTKSAVAEALGEAVNSKRVADIMQQLADKNIISNKSGSRGRTDCFFHV